MEHAPPRQMFKGFDCDSITAPSCDKHNSEKSGNDQAIVCALLIPLKARQGEDRLAVAGLSADVVKAIKMAEKSFARSRRRARQAPLISDAPPALRNRSTVSYLDPATNIYGWMRQLTAALVCHACGGSAPEVDWESALSFSPDYWPSPTPPHPLPAQHASTIAARMSQTQALLEKGDWRCGWSATPRAYPPTIYKFRVLLGTDTVDFAHTFYEHYTWYVRFSAPDEVLRVLASRAPSHEACERIGGGWV